MVFSSFLINNLRSPTSSLEDIWKIRRHRRSYFTNWLKPDIASELASSWQQEGWALQSPIGIGHIWRIVNTHFLQNFLIILSVQCWSSETHGWSAIIWGRRTWIVCIGSSTETVILDQWNPWDLTRSGWFFRRTAAAIAWQYILRKARRSVRVLQCSLLAETNMVWWSLWLGFYGKAWSKSAPKQRRLQLPPLSVIAGLDRRTTSTQPQLRWNVFWRTGPGLNLGTIRILWQCWKGWKKSGRDDKLEELGGRRNLHSSLKYSFQRTQ
jgi:hypothetical protein